MFPTTVQVGIHTYAVKEVPPKDLEGENTAEVDNERLTICISNRAVPSVQAEVCLHEILHACLAGTNFPMEEATVVILAGRLAQLFRDNPKLIRFFQKAFKA